MTIFLCILALFALDYKLTSTSPRVAFGIECCRVALVLGLATLALGAYLWS